MTGETDLGTMLESLLVAQRPGRFAFVSVGQLPSSVEGVEAIVSENEGYTLVVSCDFAVANAWAFDFEAAWLTLEVHSALESVGLTASVSGVLADAGIAANMLAGFYHDHVLVPYDQAAAAITAIESFAK